MGGPIKRKNIASAEQVAVRALTGWFAETEQELQPRLFSTCGGGLEGLGHVLRCCQIGGSHPWKLHKTGVRFLGTAAGVNSRTTYDRRNGNYTSEAFSGAAADHRA